MGMVHGTLVSHSTDVGCISEEISMKKLLLIGTVVLLTATSASAQSNGPGTAFFGPFSPGGFHSCYQCRTARPINISPTTGRTYSTEADYKAQRRSKRR